MLWVGWGKRVKCQGYQRICVAAWVPSVMPSSLQRKSSSRSGSHLCLLGRGAPSTCVPSLSTRRGRTCPSFLLFLQHFHANLEPKPVPQPFSLRPIILFLLVLSPPSSHTLSRASYFVLLLCPFAFLVLISVFLFPGLGCFWSQTIASPWAITSSLSQGLWDCWFWPWEQ